MFLRLTTTRCLSGCGPQLRTLGKVSATVPGGQIVLPPEAGPWIFNEVPGTGKTGVELYLAGWTIPQIVAAIGKNKVTSIPNPTFIPRTEAKTTEAVQRVNNSYAASQNTTEAPRGTALQKLLSWFGEESIPGVKNGYVAAGAGALVTAVAMRGRRN